MKREITPDVTERRIADFVRCCKARGLKVTHQRTEILRELAGTEEHPDAETIYQRVRQRIPAVSRDTVYRTLATLEEMGLVERVDVFTGRARFDANTDQHHHFVCTKCGLIRDFYSGELDRFAPPPQVADWGDVERVQVRLRGVCTSCKEERSSEENTGGGES